MRTPEGVWGWIWKKRRGLKISGRYLTSREKFGYFRGPSIATTHKPHTVLRRHCLAMEFTKQMESGESDDLQDSFGKFSRTTDEYLNTDAPVEQFGKRMFTMTQN